MDDTLVVGAFTAVGGFVAYVVRTLLLEYRGAIDRNTEALNALKIEIQLYHNKVNT